MILVNIFYIFNNLSKLIIQQYAYNINYFYNTYKISTWITRSGFLYSTIWLYYFINGEIKSRISLNVYLLLFLDLNSNYQVHIRSYGIFYSIKFYIYWYNIILSSMKIFWPGINLIHWRDTVSFFSWILFNIECDI